MKDRVKKIMDHYGLSNARLAQVLNINASSISHILNGRNKPGLDFLQGILKNFHEVDAEWLILGRGEMIRDVKDHKELKEIKVEGKQLEGRKEKQDPGHRNAPTGLFNVPGKEKNAKEGSDNKVSRIILLFSDGTFQELTP